MSKIITAFHLIKCDQRSFLIALFNLIVKAGWLKILNDQSYLRLMYRIHLGKKLNLLSPKTFSEKLQWLKIYDRRPEYTIMVDKYAAKKYVANRIGKDYLIPTLGVWKKLDEVDFDALPNQFVLKWNHDSKSVVICKDKSTFNRDEAIKKLRYGEKTNGYWYGREWPYKNVKPLIIAEQFISQDNPPKNDLTDYKFFCFSGVPKFVQVIQDRSAHETIDFFDMEWNHQKFCGLNSAAKKASVEPSCPERFEDMIRIARELSKGIPFSRIDLYETGNHVYFGEITLYPASGVGYFYPESWNDIIGDMLVLPHR